MKRSESNAGYRYAVIGAVVVITALFLGTCDFLTPPDLSLGNEWTDVEYEVDGPVGRERVKSLKLYIKPEGVEGQPGPDTYGVKMSSQQRAIRRALSADTAAAAHDFFEAVFIRGDGQPVRVTWEIGYPAGISGGSTGLNLSAIAQTFGGYTGNNSATVFVGRKQNKTLLGVGHLTHVNDAMGTNLILAETNSITFTVTPLITGLGYQGTTPGAAQPWTVFRTNGSVSAATFVTSIGTPYGQNRAFRPVAGQDPVYYPLFDRTTGPVATPTNITSGTYTIGGISGDILQSIRIYGPGMQVIKRKPAFLYQGRTYQAGTIYDSFTTTTLGAGYVNTSGTALSVSIPITFNVTAQSSGIFAITWQCPVFAISNATSTVDSSKPTKWFVRPADGPNLYLLDSGYDEGGMVMIGDVTSLTDDWIEIKTTGIGFSND